MHISTAECDTYTLPHIRHTFCYYCQPYLHTSPVTTQYTCVYILKLSYLVGLACLERGNVIFMHILSLLSWLGVCALIPSLYRNSCLSMCIRYY